MESFKCPTCGGTLEISFYSASTVCDSCGSRTQVGYDKTKEYKRLYDEADRVACMNTVDGYVNAIELLDSISFVKEAKTKKKLCEARLEALRDREAARAAADQDSGRRETKVGVIMLVVIAVAVLAALVGAVILMVNLVRGRLSPTATAVVIGGVVLFLVGVVVSKIKS